MITHSIKTRLYLFVLISINSYAMENNKKGIHNKSIEVIGSKKIPGLSNHSKDIKRKNKPKTKEIIKSINQNFKKIEDNLPIESEQLNQQQLECWQWQQQLEIWQWQCWQWQQQFQLIGEAHQQINGKFNIGLYNYIFNWSTEEQLKINENEEKNAISYKINNGFIIPFFNQLNQEIPKTLNTEQNLKEFLFINLDTPNLCNKIVSNKNLCWVLCFLLDIIITDFNQTQSFESKVLLSDIGHSESLMPFLYFNTQHFVVQKFFSFSDMIHYFFDDQSLDQECQDSSDDEIIEFEKATKQPKDKKVLKDKFLKRLFIAFFKIINTHEHILVSYLYSKINLKDKNESINLLLQFLSNGFNDINTICNKIQVALEQTSESIKTINQNIKTFLTNQNITHPKQLFLVTSTFNHKYIVYKDNQNGEDIIVKEFFRDNLTCKNLKGFIRKYCALHTFDIYNFKQKFREARWESIITFIKTRIPNIKDQNNLNKIIEYKTIIENFAKDLANHTTTSLEKKIKKKEIIEFLLNLYMLQPNGSKRYGLNCGFNDKIYHIICKEFHKLKKTQNSIKLKILKKKPSNKHQVIHHPNKLINYNKIPGHIIKSVIIKYDINV